jgi:hypothetical protein
VLGGVTFLGSRLWAASIKEMAFSKGVPIFMVVDGSASVVEVLREVVGSKRLAWD